MLEQLSHWPIQVYIICSRTAINQNPACSSTPQTADGSSMSSLGNATLHLCIADFKFSHTFIICDKLPEMYILFVIDLQKRYSLSYCWNLDKQLFIQREGSFFTYMRNCEWQHNVVVKSALNYHLDTMTSYQ